MASICSANRYVLEAAMLQARKDRTCVLIESTSGQVNQFGGYSGMRPGEFATYVKKIAKSVEFPLSQIILGGDHLGPNPWKTERSDQAMAKASNLVQACVRAGYTKIHIDASMSCAGDPTGAGFSTEIIAERTAMLCRAAENVYSRKRGRNSAPYYVIGSEVPPPGGADKDKLHVAISKVKDVRKTMNLTKQAFFAQGLSQAWNRVIAIVVNPGVEYGDTQVAEYRRKPNAALARFIRKQTQLVYEAHSTDYQTEKGLRQMVVDGFGFLKVGPGATYVFREAVFSLEAMEKEYLSHKRGISLSCLRRCLEKAMCTNPNHWKGYYSGSQAELRFSRAYSLSDRCRYYWGYPGPQKALRRLIGNLSSHPLPLTLISQYMPAQYQAIREGILHLDPIALIRHKVMELMGIYSRACGHRLTS